MKLSSLLATYFLFLYLITLCNLTTITRVSSYKMAITGRYGTAQSAWVIANLDSGKAGFLANGVLSGKVKTKQPDQNEEKTNLEPAGSLSTTKILYAGPEVSYSSIDDARLTFCCRTLRVGSPGQIPCPSISRMPLRTRRLLSTPSL